MKMETYCPQIPALFNKHKLVVMFISPTYQVEKHRILIL